MTRLHSSQPRRTTARPSLRRLGIALAASTALGLAAPAASLAATGGQSVSGITAGTLAITATPVVLTGFSPGSTATGTGTLSAMSTNNSWTLSVQDTATGNPGHMVAAGTGCTGSESHLATALSVTATSALGGVSSSGPVSISGTNQTVATGSGVLGTTALTTSYSNPIASSEPMLTGCSYSLTATYTLQ